MKRRRCRYVAALTAFALVPASVPAFAGRPLTVDDASVNDRGNGHIEFWYADNGPDSRGLTLAPAYAPLDRLELSCALSRNTVTRMSTVAAQAKFLLTERQKDGCNVGLVGGASKVTGDHGETIYGNTLMTCDTHRLALHVNAGAYRSRVNESTSTIATWGVAVEREFGVVTGHAEAYGERHSKPTIQVGLRGEIAPKLQLDATLGRRDAETLFSVGFKVQF